MSLLLPTWFNSLKSFKNLPKPNQLVNAFTSKLHWELSSTMTSNHLLAMVAMSNTLMSMKAATFSHQYQHLMR